MIAATAFGLVCLGGLWLVLLGLLCAAAPAQALRYLAMMGSTWTINLVELGIRALIGAAMVVHAPLSREPSAFTLIGWFLVISAAIILAVPRPRHHAFARGAAQRIQLWMVRWLISVSSIGAGLILIWAAL